VLPIIRRSGRRKVLIRSFSRIDFLVRTAAAGFGGLVVESPLALAQTAFERVRYLLLDTRVIDRTKVFALVWAQ